MLYKEKQSREQCKFLIKCRFFNIFPKHLQCITKNLKDNYMFSKKCVTKQNKLTEKMTIQVLNIEIIDLHTKITWLNREIIKLKNH